MGEHDVMDGVAFVNTVESFCFESKQHQLYRRLRISGIFEFRPKRHSTILGEKPAETQQKPGLEHEIL